MTVYLDTSALVKLFVEETDTAQVRELAVHGPVAVSALGRVEARATFARMRRDRRLGAEAAAAVADGFEDWWRDVAVVEVTPRVLDRSADIAHRHALRGYDAVHLASALELPAEPPPVFACFDGDLSRAAADEGLSPPEGW